MNEIEKIKRYIERTKFKEEMCAARRSFPGRFLIILLQHLPRPCGRRLPY